MYALDFTICITHIATVATKKQMPFVYPFSEFQPNSEWLE